MANSSTQLACPHCGSTLTFGTAIAAGTPVECLICMQSFAAQPLAAAPRPVVAAAPSIHAADMPTMSDTATASIPKAKSAATASVPMGKPARTEIAPKPKTPVPVAAKANPDAELPAAPAIRKPVSTPMGGRIALVAVALGLAFLLTGGIVFAIVKITSSTRGGNGENPVAENPSPQVADNGKKPGSGNPDAKGNAKSIGNPAADAAPASQDGKGSTNAVLSDEENEQLRIKIREETKQVLKRKVPSSGGDEPEWQPINTVNGGKQPLDLTQQKINAAIDKGIVYLRASQAANGTWSDNHAVGHAALGGLTFLECKVPADDAAVQRAALFVRNNVGNLNFTYELSLAIIFLDRLGDPRDRVVIQGMAMRLLAGQNDWGGWNYVNPTLTPQEMLQLYNFLQSNRKPNLLEPLQGKTPGEVRGDPQAEPLKEGNPFKEFNVMAQNPAANPKKAKNPPKMAPIPVGNLHPNLQNLPVVRNQGTLKGKMNLRGMVGDNSNTQFALLGLWTARRHDVPIDAALLASFQRFTTSQNADGGWGYHPQQGSSNTMTTVGLLGLAMGHGASPDIIRFNPKDPKDLVVKPAIEDPRIQNGLQALARNIGQPRLEKNATFPMENLYFLWSVERVAMLYDLKTIGGKDWYGWGAQILVHNQQASGAWPTAHYHGNDPPLNTCFALLFLKRSNLVQDLTNNLRLYTGIRESEK